MDLNRYRNENNIDDKTVVLDGESVLLALLLQDRDFGSALTEKGLNAYHNKLVNYFTAKGVPVRFTYLSEDSNRIIEEKLLGLRCNEPFELDDEDKEQLTSEIKKSPCIDAYADGGNMFYQLSIDIIHEKSQPWLFNNAINSWMGYPYYTYLLRQLAPNCTVDKETMEVVSACAESFAKELKREDRKECFDTFILGSSVSKVAHDEKTEENEVKVSTVYNAAREHSQIALTDDKHE